MAYQLLSYTDFPLSVTKKKYDKVLRALAAGDFRSADVKKLPETGIFRAKLDAAARLLFRFVRHGDQTYLLLLEVLPNHEYEKSRFLRGAGISEETVERLAMAAGSVDTDAEPLRYLNPDRRPLHFLDKFISFDDEQQTVLHLPEPLIIIGSAGSGKTALTLERLKLLKGNIAYFSLSTFLVENAQNLYYAQHYENERQEIDFLSFRDYLASLRIPEGREVDFRAFEGFYQRYRSQAKIKEPYKLYEEFKGVITGAAIDKAYLSEEEYSALGIRQSVFTAEQRPEVYALFRNYLRFLQAEGFYDTNLIAYEYLALARPLYDHIIVDEVQDFTNIQLKLLLQSLKNPVGFVLCGDANQIVHPNFFSWSALKSMFYRSELDTDIIRILQTNYRNAAKVTELANRLLRIKNLRFGSIDRESTHLIQTASALEGEVELLQDTDKSKAALNRSTGRSTRFAVLVMSNEDKAEARRHFSTPLIFSVQEAKGLEYENIILVNFISRYEKEFRVVAEDIDAADLEGALVYARNRDKSNKELDTYKFYVNSLYVAMTRAVRNLYIVEDAVKHPLLQLLGLAKVKEQTALKETQSSLDDWKKEARRLEQQGKKEQSEAVRQYIAKQENRPVLRETELAQLKIEALNPAQFNNQAKKKLFQYAASIRDWDLIRQLEALKFPEARKYFEKLDREFRLFAADCGADRVDGKNRFIQQYGANFMNKEGENGLFAAVGGGAVKSLKFLLSHGADRMARNAAGLTPLQEAIRMNASGLAALAYYTSRGEAVESRYNLGAFGQVYDALRAPAVTVRTVGRQLRIGSHSMEYFLLQMMLGMTQHIQSVKEFNSRKRWEGAAEWEQSLLTRELNMIGLGLSMDDLMTFIEQIPESILPAYRRKRQYVNSILAKNEVDGKDPYNKQLFKRTARGIYVVNPGLEEVTGSQ